MSDRHNPVGNEQGRDPPERSQSLDDGADLSDAERGTSSGDGAVERSCLMIVAVAIVIGLLWLALLYLGIPLGVLGGGVAAYLFKTSPDEPDHYTSDRAYSRAKRDRRNAVFLGALSVALAVASLVGNYFSKDGPLHPYLTGQAPTAPENDGDD